MIGLDDLNRVLARMPKDTPLSTMPFATIGETHGAIVAPNLTEKEAETLMVVLDQLRHPVEKRLW